VTSPVHATRVAWLVGSLALALLAWQGDHVARWLPQLEHGITELGPWGPIALIGAIVLLEPLLVPDSIFGIAAGATFGLLAGTAYYFVGVYLMCLGVQFVSRRWLQTRVLRLLVSRPRLHAALRSAPQGGARFTFLVRLVPINQALLSYALGAADVPLRFAVLGNTSMFTHMLPTVYFGAAAAHLTHMAASGHREWEMDGVLLMLGLGVCVFTTLQVTRRAWAAIGADGGAPDASAAVLPRTP
jgi:uncharacterized membrane protein YdjX (TVP38/TMEM64 family)